MKNELIKKENGVYEIKGTIDAKEWKDLEEKAIEILSKKVQIKGFRKGQAPIQLVRSRINPMDLLNEWTNQGLNTLYRNILREFRLNPFIQPGVNIDDQTADSLTATFKITVHPEITLGQYKGIEIELDRASVTDSDVDAEIEKLLSDNSELVLKEEPAALGDTVVFDFKGYVDGKEFEGGSAQNYSLVLGSGQFVPGFEDQLVGAKSETKVDVNITFPEQYVENLAGKDAKFVCMIHEIKTKKAPELNDEFVKTLNIGGVETVEQLKEYETKQITLRKEQQARQKHLEAVVSTICDNAEVTIADAVIKEEVSRYHRSLLSQLEQNGLTLDQYKQITGLDDEKINEQYAKEARSNLVRSSVLQKLAQVENLIVSNKELEEQFARIASTYHMDVAEVKKYYGTPEAQNELVQQILGGKLQRFILANNPPKQEEVKEESKPAAKKKTATKKAAAKKEKSSEASVAKKPATRKKATKKAE